MPDTVLLTEQERAGLFQAQVAINTAKCEWADAQMRVSEAQRALKLAEAKLEARLLAYADAHGLKGSVTLSDDGTKLLAG